MVYNINTMQDCPVIEKNEKKKKPSAATWMALEGTMLTEMSDRETQILHDITDR